MEKSPSPAPKTDGVTAAPSWLGKRVLPRRPDGFGEVRPTPEVLRNRRLPTLDFLRLPKDGGFFSSVMEVPREVRARSTWSPGCPVAIDDLRYMQVTFWGFDREAHLGELIVHKSAARQLVDVFRGLFRARYPIEEMRVVTKEELDAPPTGDGNNTTSFVCRPARGSTTWSQHAYGLAVDINPFHNPYVRGDLVLPELSSSYKNREWKRPGMILDGGPVVAAFDEIGWGWGGRWNSLVDYMHFSANGR
jgi:D-alanyl-D-alanine carboxypeptidase